MIYKNYEMNCPKYKQLVDLGIELIDISTMDKPDTYMISLLCNCSYMLGKICSDCPFKDLTGLELPK